MNQTCKKNTIFKDAVLRAGEVSGIQGRKVYITLDKSKNVSELLYNGNILKNISVGSYIEIRKGFLSIIGKVEGEKLDEDKNFLSSKNNENQYQKLDKNKRILTVTLSGYMGVNGTFTGGIKELPLIGNEAFIVTEAKINKIHNLLRRSDDLQIRIAKTNVEEIPINFPIDGILNSHIAIFGNTGSGKSNTLAALYQETIKVLKNKSSDFNKNSRFLIFDFNGEYTGKECIHSSKKIYNLNTEEQEGNKIPMSFNELMNIETLSILLEATEKTQKPFLKRALWGYKGSTFEKLKNKIIGNVVSTLKMDNKNIAFRILDYLEEILIFWHDRNKLSEMRKDIIFHDTNKYFYLKDNTNCVAYKNNFIEKPEKIKETFLYKNVARLTKNKWNKMTKFNQFFIFILLQLIDDLHQYKIQMEHIIPVINRFKAKQKDIEKTFDIESSDLWEKNNIVVINLREVNLDMRKTIPLLLAKHVYNKHKQEKNKKSLSIIIDEAHNILSKTSFRETEDWKDYRLETFEEIIKEGRKFGVFVTIASQRPNDISETIISQVHNYFIHQLLNQRDLQTIGNAVSYIDRITEESIPTLPVGTCVFSGIATPMPLKITIDELPDKNKPESNTLQFRKILPRTPNNKSNPTVSRKKTNRSLPKKQKNYRKSIVKKLPI